MIRNTNIKITNRFSSLDNFLRQKIYFCIHIKDASIEYKLNTLAGVENLSLELISQN